MPREIRPSVYPNADSLYSDLSNTYAYHSPDNWTACLEHAPAEPVKLELIVPQKPAAPP